MQAPHRENLVLRSHEVLLVQIRRTAAVTMIRKEVACEVE